MSAKWQRVTRPGGRLVGTVAKRAGQRRQVCGDCDVVSQSACRRIPRPCRSGSQMSSRKVKAAGKVWSGGTSSREQGRVVASVALAS